MQELGPQNISLLSIRHTAPSPIPPSRSHQAAHPPVRLGDIRRRLFRRSQERDTPSAHTHRSHPPCYADALPRTPRAPA